MRLAIDATAAVSYSGTGIGVYTHQIIKNILELDQFEKLTLMWGGEVGTFDWSSGRRREDRSIGVDWAGWLDEGELAEAIRSTDSQVYHVPQNGFGLIEGLPSRAVITLHDVIPFRWPEVMSAGYNGQFVEFVPEAAERADAIITDSEYSKADICSTLGVSPSKVHVTYLAAEARYRPVDQREAAHFVKEKHQIEGCYILYVGGIGERKNIATLILAFAAVKKKTTRPLRLVIAGHYSYLCESLFLLCDALGIRSSVDFPGPIPAAEMVYLYNAAALFAYLSLYEGFGLPPLEAMACGLPTITSNTTSLPEVVADGAICVDPLDAGQVAEAIHGILEDRRLHDDLATRGIARSSQFSWKTTAQQTLQSIGRSAPNRARSFLVPFPSEGEPLRPISIVIMTAARPENYLSRTLESLAPDRPTTLMVGSRETDYLAEHRRDPLLRLVFPSPDEFAAIAGESTHRRAAWNYGRSLGEAIEGGRLLIFEDDVVFANAWRAKLDRIVGRIEEDCADYVLSLYYPYPPQEQTEGFVVYRKAEFYGTQGVLFAGRTALEFRRYLLERWADPPTLPYDLLLGRFTIEVDVPLFATMPSLIQHIGVVSTGQSDHFHTTACFGDGDEAPT